MRHRPRRKSSGYPERQGHIEAIRSGATGLGVVCVSAIPVGNEKRHLRGFDSESLLLLGKLTEDTNAIYATVTGRVKVADLSSLGGEQDSIESDVIQILENKDLDSTTKIALVQARVGQGQFRKSVLAKWGARCAVTGCRTPEMRQASDDDSPLLWIDIPWERRPYPIKRNLDFGVMTT